MTRDESEMKTTEYIMLYCQCGITYFPTYEEDLRKPHVKNRNRGERRKIFFLIETK